MQLATWKKSFGLQFAKYNPPYYGQKCISPENRRKGDGIHFANEPPSADDNKESEKQKKAFCFSAAIETIMSRKQIKIDSLKLQGENRLFPMTTRIPVQFVVDLPLHYEVKVRPKYFITALSVASKKPLIPALFQMAAFAGDPKVMPALKSVLEIGRSPLDDAMLDAEKLDAVIRAIARKKKPAGRRATANRI